jgi:hypothetical protein
MNAHIEIGPTAEYLSRVAVPAMRSLIVAGAAAASLYALRISGTKVRLAVWRSVLGVALAMPLLSFVVPAMPMSMKFLDATPAVRDALRPIFALESAPVVASAKTETATGTGEIRTFHAIVRHEAASSSISSVTRLERGVANGTHVAKNVSDAAGSADGQATGSVAAVAAAGLKESKAGFFARLRDQARSEISFSRGWCWEHDWKRRRTRSGSRGRLSTWRIAERHWGFALRQDWRRAPR